MENARFLNALKIPRKRLVRNGRFALGFTKTGGGRGGEH